MRVTCPNCATVYNLPDEHVRPGAKLKCTECAHTFPLVQEDEAGQVAGVNAEELLSDTGQGDDFLQEHDPLLDETQVQDDSIESLLGHEDSQDPDFGLETPSASLESMGGDEYAMVDELVGAKSDQVSLSGQKEEPASDKEILGLGDHDELSFNLDEGKKKKKGKKARAGKEKGKGKGKDKAKKKSSPGLILLALLVVVGAGAYMYWDKLEELYHSMTQAEEEEADPQAEEPDYLELAEHFSYAPGTPVHQFLDNDKIGRILVIQGLVVNNYGVPKELIRVEAQLLDELGQVLESKTQLIGNTVSHYQLQLLSQEELENAVNLEVGILRNNTNIAPGDEVPFVFIFYNPSDQVQEYVLRVVEAKDPPPADLPQ